MAIFSWYKCKLKNLDPAVPTKMVLMSIKSVFCLYSTGSYYLYTTVIFFFFKRWNILAIFKTPWSLTWRKQQQQKKQHMALRCDTTFSSRVGKVIFWLGTCSSADKTGEAPPAATPWRCLIYSTNNSLELSKKKKSQEKKKSKSRNLWFEWCGVYGHFALLACCVTWESYTPCHSQDKSLRSLLISVRSAVRPGVEAEEEEEEGAYRKRKRKKGINRWVWAGLGGAGPAGAPRRQDLGQTNGSGTDFTVMSLWKKKVTGAKVTRLTKWKHTNKPHNVDQFTSW